MYEDGTEDGTICAALNAPAQSRGARACWWVPVLLGSMLAACSTGGEGMLLLVDSGKYQYHTCGQIADAAKAISGRREELATLIARAEQGTGGAIVGAIAYRTEYTTTGQELQVIETTARAKNCNNPANWRSNSAVQ